MPTPTKEQLERINRFSMEPLTEDDVYVFEDLMIDDQETAYHTVLHENLLRKFVTDINKGISLQLNHNSYQLPTGKSFGARLQEDVNESGDYIKSVYGEFFIDRDRQLEAGISTNDVIKGVEAGVISDSSIGFNATEWKCSICGNDIRDWWSCSHIPGKKYAVTRNDEDSVEKCVVIVGENGVGEILENSLVYAGACDRASIVQNYCKDVRYSEKGTKLRVVSDFKDVPLDAKIYQYYAKDGVVLLVDTDKSTGGAEQLRRRSELGVDFEKLMGVLDKYGIQAGSEEGLASALEAMTSAQAQLADKEAELATSANTITELNAQLDNANSKLVEADEKLSAKDTIITELTAANEELTQKAGLVETYRNDLVQQALTLGVRAQGNAFKTDLYERFLATLSIDEIKEVVTDLQAEVDAKFEVIRVSDATDRSLENRLNKQPSSKADFENEVEFRAYVAEKASEYSEEKGVSLIDATKEMYRKYSQNGSDD